MKNRSILILSLVIFLLSCGSSTPDFTALKKPVSISLSSETISFRGNTTQFAYVADAFSQSISVIDTFKEELTDTADGDEFDFTPIPVGGEPSAVVVDDSVSPHRVFVADRFNNHILGYTQSSIDEDHDIVKYTPISLGGTMVGKASRAMFKNSGAASSPSLTSMVVSPTEGTNESWRLEYDNGKYKVTGTTSGLQNNFAIEGDEYTTDNGGLSFFISPGGEKTTDGDEFFFGTVVARPLELISSPVDLLIHEGKMYILTQNVPSIVVMDLESLDIESTTDFPDLAAVPTKMALKGDKIYVSNLNSNSFFEYDIDSPGFATIASGLDNPIRSIGVDRNRLFLIEDKIHRVNVWNLSTDSVEETIMFNDAGNDFFVGESNGLTVGLIPNASGDVDVIDTDSLNRVDTDLSEKTVFFSEEFFDVLPESNPQLISVNTDPSHTLNEFWQMTFEGVVPNMIDMDGTFTGDVITAAGVDFEAAGVKEGDLVVVPSKDKEIEIESVDSPTSLTLQSTPSFGGSQTFEIRTNGTYIVVGSISGVQENRATPGVTYTSDDDQISLLTSTAFDKPETRGDFFSFETADTIDPIEIGGQGVAVSGMFMNKLSDGKPVAYVLEQSTGQVAIVDLTDYKTDKTL